MPDPVLTPAEVLAAEDARFKAVIERDIAQLERLFGDDLVYVHPSGQMDDKTAYLNAVRKARAQYRRFDRQSQQVRVFGDTAVVTGKLVLEVTVEGRDMSLPLTFLSLLCRRAGMLQCVSWQTTQDRTGK